MNLTPEERQCGEENFHAALGNKLVRYDFLKQCIAERLATGAGLGAKYFGYGKPPSEPVRVGVIGTGDEGGVLIGAINPKYVQVVAIADIRPYNIYRAFHGDSSSANALRVRPGLITKYGWADEAEARRTVKVYADRYEELLDDENVEAVIVALPLHLHAEASIKAMRKGKHVLTEKLMGHSVHECKEMARVAAETDKLLAVGHQRHYSPRYNSAVTLVKNNLIGDVHHIRAQWHRANLPGNDSWQPPLPDEQMGKALDAARQELDQVKQEFESKRDAARAALTSGEDKKSQDLKELLDKWDGELEAHPKEIAERTAELAALEGAEDADARRKEITDRIQALEKRLRDVKREYPRRLNLDPDLIGRLQDLSRKVDVYAYQMMDADIDPKKYGYIERSLPGGYKQTALEELVRWRLWARTGGGLMAELGSHQLDAAGIFVSSLRDDGKKVQPLSVSAVGGRHLFPADRDIEDHVYCTYEYPAPGYDPETNPEKKIVVHYSSINGNGFGDYGEIVYGTEGTLMLERESSMMLFWIRGATPPTSTYVKVVEKTAKDADGNPTKTLALAEGSNHTGEARLGRDGLKGADTRGYTEEIEHFAYLIRNPDAEVKFRCDAHVALADAVIALTSNIAMAENGRINFKPEWFDIDSDETPEGVAPDVNRPAYQV